MDSAVSPMVTSDQKTTSCLIMQRVRFSFKLERLYHCGESSGNIYIRQIAYDALPNLKPGRFKTRRVIDQAYYKFFCVKTFSGGLEESPLDEV